jgi:hypothetical protein
MSCMRTMEPNRAFRHQFRRLVVGVPIFRRVLSRRRLQHTIHSVIQLVTGLDHPIKVNQPSSASG